MRVLVANAGSSSLKLRLLDPGDHLVASQELEITNGRADQGEVAEALRRLGSADAVGHRIVHGGAEFTHAVRVDRDVERRLHALVGLAPLHQAIALDVMATVSHTLPQLPVIACFDTAFHCDMPADAATYALPETWRRKWNLRRYGFHGLSRAYSAWRAAQVLARNSAGLRVVTCHLGAGASLAAVMDNHSRDTTMGFTPLEGLVMATRPGNVDAGLLLWLEQHEGVSAAELSDALEHRSGLLGLTGTPDMKQILLRAGSGDPSAQLGLDVYIHRLRAGVASMAAAMGGLDVLVFTGGVGENAPEVRQRAANGLRFLGVVVDPELNGEGHGDREISRAGAGVRTLVVIAREDIEIARQVREVMSARAPSATRGHRR